MQRDKPEYQAAVDRVKRDIEFLRDEALKTRRERDSAQADPDGGSIYNYRQNLTMRGVYLTGHLREVSRLAAEAHTDAAGRFPRKRRTVAAIIARLPLPTTPQSPQQKPS